MLSKILLITQREYLTRVRKKSFIVMTIAAPLLVVAFYSVVIYLSIDNRNEKDTRTIYLNDETGIFANKLSNNRMFTFVSGEILSDNEQSQSLKSGEYYGILNIEPGPDSLSPNSKLITSEQPSFTMVNSLQSELNDVLKNKIMIQYGMDEKTMEEINKPHIELSTKLSTSEGLKASNAGVTSALGFIGAFAIYMFIFLYGVQVMQGVIEEKTNRIVEVIISSVKPFELMMGKVVGIALVGLTQFAIWGILITILGGGASGMVFSMMGENPVMAENMQAAPGSAGEIFSAIGSINFTLLIGMFIFYFLSGYLFYGALFAAIGAAVDNETDKQQFMLPVTMPLIFTFIMSQSMIVNDPNGTMAFWLSMIPFTSPIAMMVRLPFGVDTWQLILSMVLMVGGFIGTTWVAARIYRTGILMYGKKASWGELWKWLKY